MSLTTYEHGSVPMVKCSKFRHLANSCYVRTCLAKFKLTHLISRTSPSLQEFSKIFCDCFQYLRMYSNSSCPEDLISFKLPKCSFNFSLSIFNFNVLFYLIGGKGQLKLYFLSETDIKHELRHSAFSSHVTNSFLSPHNRFIAFFFLSALYAPPSISYFQFLPCTFLKALCIYIHLFALFPFWILHFLWYV